MSALTTDKTLFNANGVFDPEVFKTGVAIKRKIDFGLANATGSTNYEFLPLPKGFILKGLLVKELEKCSASTTATVKTASDSATIGAAVSVGGSTLAKTFARPVAGGTFYGGASSGDTAATTAIAVPGSDKVVADGDMLCLVTGAALTGGIVEITVIGDVYDGDTLNGFTLTVPYRSAGQITGANASKGDIYLNR